MSALFLWLLDGATQLRLSHVALVFALPLGGFCLGLGYERWGAPIRGGTNLVLESLHQGGAAIAARMAPMVLFGTVLTHLFGGSAGREGAAVQMGASLSDLLFQRLLLPQRLRRAVLTAGVAGGFGSVFGTPLAGALFSLEFAGLKRAESRLLVPALVASFVGDFTTRAYGLHHIVFPQLPHVSLTPILFAKWLIFSGAVALTVVCFIELTQALKRAGERFVPRLPHRMFVGGVVLVALFWVLGTDRYLGLGVPTIVQAFEDPALPVYAFALKLLFTAVTLSTGFLGGEVTPLFFVGATLGNALAQPLALPLELAAGVGLAAMFAAAANTPLALAVMAAELFGLPVLPHAALVCLVTFSLTGKRSIYSAQLGVAEARTPWPPA